MSTFKRCDGCGTDLAPDGPRFHEHPRAMIHGERSDGTAGLAPVPGGEFDWCKGCALIAFRAVQRERRPVQ